MKRLIIFVLITICINVSGQRQSKSKYKVGYKIGMTSHTISGGRAKTQGKVSLVGGIWCQIKMSKNWTTQAEVIYIEKGTGGYDNYYPQKVGEYGVALMYLEIPVLFQYHIKKLNFEFGPGLGVLTYQYENLYGATMSNLTGAYPFTTKEFSFNLGCGYPLNEKWYLGFRFTHSLLPVRKQLPDISKQVYNRVFAITLTRQIKFKKSKTVDTDVTE